MKIAILGNQARAMSNFWTVLIRLLIADGHQVLCIVPSPGPQDDIAWEIALLDLGVQIVRYPLDRKGLNPKNDLRTVYFLRNLFLRHRPDVLFSFTIKPVIYGSIAAWFAGYPVKSKRLAMITGLGYAFEADSGLKKMLFLLAKLLYRIALGRIGTVFFQNDDDRGMFERLGIIPASTQVAMTKGTGVDLQRFALTPLPSKGPSFLYIGRLLEAKGLYELHEAAAILKGKYSDVHIGLLGPVEPGLGGVPLETVLDWQEKGLITYYGETKDVRPYIAAADVVVLPSWREGTPCSLMEAMSMGRAVVAADAPGSREVVQDGVNGFLVPVKQGLALARAMERFISDPALAARLGSQGRIIAEKKFDAEKVARRMISHFEQSEAK